MRSHLWLVASASLLALATPAHSADTFNFTFTSQGDDNNGINSVSGTLFGLKSSGASAPTSIVVNYGGETFNFEPTGQQENQASGSFTVQNNSIVASNFFDNFSDPHGGYQLSLNGQNASFQNLYNGKFTDASMGVTYTPAATNAVPIVSAAPEPAAWALMIMGVAIAGCALRSRQKVRTKVAFFV